MFTDRLNLPIEPSRLQNQDQTLSLAGMTWEDYQQFIDVESLSYRLSFFNGVISIVSPSLNHEIIKETISILIVAYCRKYNLVYFPMGSTDIKNPPLAGKQPDTSYAFAIKKPKPDLAVEVVFSSGGTADLEKYRILEVEEVWFWQNKQMQFYHLVDNQYRELAFSKNLPKLSPQFLEQYVNRGLNDSPLAIEADFINALAARDLS